MHWIDVFAKQAYRDDLVESFKYCQRVKGLEIYAWCIMSNHVHMIIGSSGSNKLEDIMRDLKKFTASRIIKHIKSNYSESRKNWMLKVFEEQGKVNSNNKHYQFWIQDNHPIVLDSNFLLDQKLEYIHDNPVKAGIVLSPEEYLYSSAKNYHGLQHEALLEVMLID